MNILSLIVAIFYFLLPSVDLHQMNRSVEDLDTNPEEHGNFLEGDILPSLTNHSSNEDEDLSPDPRNGIKSKGSRWIAGVIPYKISNSFPSKERDILMKAFDEFHRTTCIRFRLHVYESDYLLITSKSNGCWSRIGRQGGRQIINFETPLCFRKFGTILHELMHAIGFFHEQNRSERDNYVEILYENIQENMQRNFDKLKPEKATAFGVPYDYGSVMHYRLNSFSRNGKPTLRPLQNVSKDIKIGQRKGFSTGDIKKIRAMYKCYRSKRT